MKLATKGRCPPTWLPFKIKFLGNEMRQENVSELLILEGRAEQSHFAGNERVHLKTTGIKRIFLELLINKRKIKIQTTK